MKELNLQANCYEEEKILNYLKENVSDTLADKINSKPMRAMTAALNYCFEEAKKIFNERKCGHCVIVDDPTVYGWCVHFYEDVEGAEEVAKANKLFDMLNDENAEPMPKAEKTMVKAIDDDKKEEPAKNKVDHTAEELLKAYKQLSIFDELDM